jgi:hypothetical protein
VDFCGGFVAEERGGLALVVGAWALEGWALETVVSGVEWVVLLEVEGKVGFSVACRAGWSFKLQRPSGFEFINNTALHGIALHRRPISTALLLNRHRPIRLPLPLQFLFLPLFPLLLPPILLLHPPLLLPQLQLRILLNQPYIIALVLILLPQKLIYFLLELLDCAEGLTVL